ncbi:MAG TPA: helix-turn-helix domain-containing protein [Gemmatimonadales bacterium]|nr:helix-turn-helix domain-containing protein [Gemmatimonadales bacterium]
MGIDLTPFGFTPTESLVYGALLRSGPGTGYSVARAAHLARANAYGALEGLVARGAASRAAGRPARYRPADPATLIAQLAQSQAVALDRLRRSLADAPQSGEPEARAVTGARAVVNLIQQLVARAETTVEGILAAELWRPTLPAWRRAATRARLSLRMAGPVDDAAGIAIAEAPADAPTLLVVDGAHMVTAGGGGETVSGLWSSHPLMVTLAGAALRGVP